MYIHLFPYKECNWLLTQASKYIKIYYFTRPWSCATQGEAAEAQQATCSGYYLTDMHSYVRCVTLTTTTYSVICTSRNACNQYLRHEGTAQVPIYIWLLIQYWTMNHKWPSMFSKHEHMHRPYKATYFYFTCSTTKYASNSNKIHFPFT